MSQSPPRVPETPLPVLSEHRVGPRGTPGHVAWPDATGTYPCVIVLHERYGMVPQVAEFTERVAAEGYVAIAADLFHAFPDQAALRTGKASVEPTDIEVLEACEDVFTLFAGVPNSDASRFGMIGICQTGRYPLVWGTRHPIQAAIVLYGAAGIKNWERNDVHPDGIDGLLEKLGAAPAARGAHVLGIFGEDDHVISLDDVQRFRNALEANMLSYQITLYPDAPHGWLNDAMPGRYRPDAAREAWNEMTAFMHRLLRGDVSDERVAWSFRSLLHADYDFKAKKRQA